MSVKWRQWSGCFAVGLCMIALVQSSFGGFGISWHTIIAESECVVGANCNGLHNPAGKRCTYDANTGTLSGECFFCDGQTTANICSYKADEECELDDDWLGQTTFACGTESAGARCKIDLAAPGGASCVKDVSLPPGHDDCQGLVACVN